jgi:phage baseplate assembly protein W
MTGAVYTGMSASTGAAINGIDHLRQSVRDILTTPIGSRVMRRAYGSRLYALLDAPISEGLIAEVRAAVAAALARWEPRLKLSRVEIFDARAGALDVNLEGEYDGETIALAGVLGEALA